MKKQNWSAYLKKQYDTLTARLEKAMKTGKFYQYSQFKQQQLLQRLQRYVLQLRKVGVAVAVGAALTAAAPQEAAAQIQFQLHTGASNPFDSIPIATDFTHADIDGDGDLDLVAEHYDNSSYLYYQDYYENVSPLVAGTPPQYVLRTPIISSQIDDRGSVSFVDIDGDGDLDCFTNAALSGYSVNYSVKNVYLENTGTMSSPNFVEQPSSLNPLDSFNYISVFTNSQNASTFSFIDIDGDGDQDFFSVDNSDFDTIFHFKNIGTANNPIFQQENTHVLSNIIYPKVLRGRLYFADIDADGDQDLMFFNSNTSSNYGIKYFENTGTAQLPNFVEPATSPLANLPTAGIRRMFAEDVDNDGDVDFIIQQHNFILNYYENLTITSVSKIESQAIELAITPNPTKGQLQLEYPISGILQVSNLSGQVVYSRILDQEQQLNLSELEKGVYFLNIQTENGLVTEKIQLH